MSRKGLITELDTFSQNLLIKIARFRGVTLWREAQDFQQFDCCSTVVTTHAKCRPFKMCFL